MGRFFDNGATRARAQAWGRWLLFGAVWAGVALEAPAPSPWRWPCLITVLGMGSWLILVRRLPRKLPVLNYHSVSPFPEWLRIPDELSLEPSTFERQLAYLKRHGYRTVFIGEMHALLAGNARLKPGVKCVALTFDDGYADTWMAAFPLLKKYEMKATLFVSTDFIVDANACRSTIEKRSPERWIELDWTGYLTWPELEAMRDSGLVEIQSHGAAHTRVFAGSELRGFVGPDKPNLWLFWNTRPEARRRWWRELDVDRSLWGHPVFRQAPHLAQRAFRPDPEAVAHMLSWVKGAGVDVFATADGERRLREEWGRCGCEPGGQGEWESAEDYERRVARDLADARRTLRAKLGVRSDVMCWPENAFSDTGERIARRTGYTATVSNRHAATNAAGEAPDRVVRVFIGSPAAGIRSARLDFAVFILELKVFEGWYILYPPLALLHAARKVALGAKRHWVCRRDYLSIWR
jgi:peptidoglycan/xylan/chitin deacetylase (PgdA/CDA1 family)